MRAFSFLLILALALEPTAGADSNGIFVNPPKAGPTFVVNDNVVFKLGEVQVLEWVTGIDSYDVLLWSQALNGGASAASTPVFSKKAGDPEPGGFNWTVQTYSYDLNESPIFFLGIDFDGTDGSGFTSHYFNITTEEVDRPPPDPPEPTTSGTTTPPGDEPTDTPSPPPEGGDDSASQASLRIGLGLGLGLGIPLVAVVAGVGGFLFFRYRSRKSAPGGGGGPGSEIGATTAMAEGGDGLYHEPKKASGYSAQPGELSTESYHDPVHELETGSTRAELPVEAYQYTPHQGTGEFPDGIHGSHHQLDGGFHSTGGQNR